MALHSHQSVLAADGTLANLREIVADDASLGWGSTRSHDFYTALLQGRLEVPRALLQQAPADPDGHCRILHDKFGVGMQFTLFMGCISVLIIKFAYEKLTFPTGKARTLKVFAFDSSKQFIGSGVVHGWNMGGAWLFSRMGVGEGRLGSAGWAGPTRTSSSSSSSMDECSWYFMNIMIDTTVGLYISYCLLRLTERWCGYQSGWYAPDGTLSDGKLGGTRATVAEMTNSGRGRSGDSGSGLGLSSPSGRSAKSGSASGNESSPAKSSSAGEDRLPSSPASYAAWREQILVWCLVISAMKLIVIFVVMLGGELLFCCLPPFSLLSGGKGLWEMVGDLTINLVLDNEKKLFIVMVGAPVLMNFSQFIITDNFLKYDSAREVPDVMTGHDSSPEKQRGGDTGSGSGSGRTPLASSLAELAEGTAVGGDRSSTQSGGSAGSAGPVVPSTSKDASSPKKPTGSRLARAGFDTSPNDAEAGRGSAGLSGGGDFASPKLPRRRASSKTALDTAKKEVRRGVETVFTGIRGVVGVDSGNKTAGKKRRSRKSRGGAADPNPEK